MFFNYCRVAWRNISRQKLFSFINIFGLALSMSIGLIVLVRLKDELGTDRFHPNGNRIYRVISQVTNKQHNTFRLASSPIPVATELQKNNAFIEAATTLYPAWNGKADANKKQINVSTVFIEPSFFKVFGFKTLSGKNNDLQAPNTAVITKDLANRFFGSTNPVGQTIQMGKLGTFLVVDVMQPAPGRSHIEYDAYLSFSSITLLQKNNILSWQAGDWNPTYGYTYVLLSEGTSEKKLASALDRIASSINKSQAADAGTLSFDTQSLLSISPGEELQFSIGNVATTGKVTAEIAIALIILLSACFNYTNLSIARALKRAKEVGIRKVNGASRHSIFLQFLVESVIISLLSLVLSGIIFSFLKEYAPFSREMIPPNIKVDGQLTLWLALFSLGTGTVAGTVPALILSAFNPVQVLKNLANVKLFGRNGFRKALTVIQFSLSLVIIIFMMTASRQFKYMATADYGFNRNNILSVPLQGADYSLLKTEIAKVGGVQRVAGLSDYPGWSASGTIMVKPLPAADGIKMGFFDVDENYLPNLQLQLLAGKNFTGATTDDERDVLLNETAAKILKITNPVDAIGKTLYMDDTIQVRVAGIIKDFHFEGFERPITPLVLRNRAKAFNYLAIQTTVSGPAAGQLTAQIKNIWKKVNPLQPFTSNWFADSFYERKSATGTVSMLEFLAFIAISIACLGLLGMVIYTTETKVKEVSIRKVMGATAINIMVLLSSGFVRLVLIAVCIALPLGWVCSYMFVSIFTVRAGIGAGVLFIACFIILVAALLVISSQVYKIARSNPVNGLRTE